MKQRGQSLVGTNGVPPEQTRVPVAAEVADESIGCAESRITRDGASCEKGLCGVVDVWCGGG